MDTLEAGMCQVYREIRIERSNSAATVLKHAKPNSVAMVPMDATLRQTLQIQQVMNSLGPSKQVMEKVTFFTSKEILTI